MSFYIDVTGRKSECVNCGKICPPDEPKIILKWGSGTHKVHKTAHLDCVENGIVVPMEGNGFDLGTSNEMTFSCKTCGKDLPSLGDEPEVDEVYRVETAMSRNHPLSWNFCSEECFDTHMIKAISGVSFRKLINLLARRLKSG